MREDRKCVHKCAEELTHIREILGELDSCVQAAVEAEDTGQWSEAYEAKKELDRKIDSYLENGKLFFQSGNVVWKCIKHDWLGAIVALLTLGIMGRKWWKQRNAAKPVIEHKKEK